MKILNVLTMMGVLIGNLFQIIIMPPAPIPPDPQVYIPQMLGNSILLNSHFCGAILDSLHKPWGYYDDYVWAVKALEVFWNADKSEWAVVYDLAYTDTALIDPETGEYFMRVRYHDYVLALHDGIEKHMPLVFTDIITPMNSFDDGCKTYILTNPIIGLQNFEWEIR